MQQPDVISKRTGILTEPWYTMWFKCGNFEIVLREYWERHGHYLPIYVLSLQVKYVVCVYSFHEISDMDNNNDQWYFPIQLW